MQGAGKEAMVVVTNPLLAARLRAASADPGPSTSTAPTSPEEERRAGRAARSSPRARKKRTKDKADRERGRSWEADELSHELQTHQPQPPAGHVGPAPEDGGAETTTTTAVGVAAKRSTSVVLKDAEEVLRESGGGWGEGGRERERTPSFLKRLSFEKRKSRDLEVRSKTGEGNVLSPSPSPRQSLMAIARKKNSELNVSAPTHETADAAADGESTPRKRAFSVACSNSAPASGSPHPAARQGRLAVGGEPSSSGADAGSVPFLNLRKMATRDDSRYHTLHGGELFTPIDAGPEEKLHRLLVSPGLEIVNAMEEILPSALRPELAAALVSVFDGCGRDQNLLMWAIQREIDMCSKLRGQSWFELRAGMATHVLTSWFMLHSQSFLGACVRPIILKLTTEERLEAIALPAGDFMRQELILECLLEVLEGLAASAPIIPQEVRFVLILAHAEMAKLNQELAPLIVARLFFSCLLRPAFTTCESSVPNFNADGYSLDFIGRHFLHIVGQGLSCLASRFTIEDEDDPLAFLNHHPDSNEAVAQLRERASHFVAALSSRSSGDNKKSAKSKKSRASAASADTTLSEGGRLGALFQSGNEWNDDSLFFFVFASLRERMIEALTKNNKALFAAKLYNLLDRCFRGQETVLALKQRQHVINEYVMTKYGQKVQLVNWRQRSRKRIDGGGGSGRRLAIREVLLDRRSSNSNGGGSGGGDLPPNSPHQVLLQHQRRANSEKPSKSLLKLMIADQRQKNQEIEDELRLIKLKLQQEIKAKRELQLQLLRRDNDNNEMKKTTEQTLQEWTEIQMMWELMAKQMNGLEQVLFPLDDDSLLQRIGSSGETGVLSRHHSTEMGTPGGKKKKTLLPFSGFKRQSGSLFSS